MNKEKLRFKSGSSPIGIDQGDLTSFAEGAKRQTTHETHNVQLPQFIQNGKRSETILFRCSQADFEDISFVFEALNVKSRQKLLESILLPEIRKIAKEIRRLT